MTLHRVPTLIALLLAIGMALPGTADAQDRNRMRDSAAQHADRDDRRAAKEDGKVSQAEQRTQRGERQRARQDRQHRDQRVGGQRARQERAAVPRQESRGHGPQPRRQAQAPGQQPRQAPARVQQRVDSRPQALSRQRQVPPERASAMRERLRQERRSNEDRRRTLERRDVDDRGRRVADQRERERRVAEQRRRDAEHQRHLHDLRVARDRHEQRLAQQRRTHQQRYLRDYYARMQSRPYRATYDAAWYAAPAAYRYQRGGHYYSVSQHAADLLQQAVDLGYREGRHAGRADREDGWRPDYRNSHAWEDASYGYDGWYVDRSEYAYYFREGFQRGYDDGYYGRSRHGRRGDDGEYLILAAVLGAILGLQQI